MTKVIRVLLFLLSFAFITKAQNGSARKVLVERYVYSQRGTDTANLTSYPNAVFVNYTLPFVKWGRTSSAFDTDFARYDLMKNTQEPYACPHCSGIWFLNGVVFRSNLGLVERQRMIDSAATNLSSFDVITRHSFNAMFDSLYIDTEVVCTRDVQGADLRLWMLPMQKYIDYQELPPWAAWSMPNGEFHNTNWEVGPDTGAIDLPETWLVGHRMSFRYAWPLSRVESTHQMYAASFIQDYSTLEVLQASESQIFPLTLPNLSIEDGTIYDAINYCNTNFTPRVVFRNLGDDTVRTIDVAFWHNGVKTNGIWNGTLAPGDSDDYWFPRVNLSTATFALTPGSPLDYQPVGNYLKYQLLKVNGIRDATQADDNTGTRIINRLKWLTTMDTIWNRNFEVPYFVDNRAFDPHGFTYDTTTRQSYLVFNFNRRDYYPYYGKLEAMLSEGISLMGRDSSTNFEFVYSANTVSYRGWDGRIVFLSDSTKTDTFALQATVDCGLNWTTLWQKSGRELMTTSFSDTSELAERHWRTVKASLAPVVGRIAHFRFVNLSHGMAQVYLDDIRIRPVPVPPPHTYVPTPYPNPTNGLLHLDLEFTGAGNMVKTSMFDALGRQVIGEVRHTLPAGLSTLAVDMSVLGNGYYYLVVNMPDGSRKSWPVSIVR